MMNNPRDAVGVILRFPIIIALAALWTITIWPYIAAFSLLVLVGKPILYWPLYLVVWLWYAFVGSKEAVLADYWKDYPAIYLDWFTLGYLGLHLWLMKGWGN